MSPSSTGLLTPASYTLNPDYFALDMSKVAYAKSPDVSPISPVGGHSKFSSRRIANEQRSQKHSDAPSENTRSPEDLAELARRKSRAREKREKDKKTMLSKALEKANTAVLLDNVQNFGGALDAYKDACHLLQLVMERTSAFEDRRKLEAIRETYTARIEELDQLQQPQTNESERPLPPRPMSNDSEVLEPAFGSHRTDDRVQEPGSPIEVAEIIPPTTATRNTGTDDTGRRTRDSFLTNAIREVEGSKQGGFLGPLWERSKSPMGLPLLREHDSRTPEQLKSPYAPPPLSPWRPVSPAPPPKDYPAKQQQTQGWQDKDLPPLSRDPDPVATSDSKPSEASKSAPPPPDSDPISWLDTIDESGSDRSSVHSGTPGHPRRKLLGRARGDSGADDFDAAFDAAVEAAYEDGYEPDTSSHFKNSGLHDPAYHRSSTDQGQSKPSTSSKSNAAASAPYLRDFDDDADERQLLDDIAREYMHHGFEFNLQSSSKPALPRESDSSGVSRSTWQSSTLSDKPTAGTSLSTLEEMDGVHRSSPAKDSQRVVSHSSTTRFGEEPAPGLLPTSTLQRPTSSQTGAEILARRSKRLSGPVLKPLKIETSARSLEPQQYNEPGSARSTRSGSSATRAAIAEEEGLQLNTARTASTDTSVSSTSKTSRVPSSGRKHTGGRTPVPASAISETDTSTSFNSSFAPQSADVFTELHSPRPRFLRKNKSSLSLRGYDVPTSSAESEMPMITPQTSTYSQAQSRSREGTFSQRAHASSSAGATDHAQVGGMYLFDTTITTAASRPTTSTSSADASLPPPLEPCPDSHLLRPFWLLRRVSQTVTHPRGGYITTRLFVPHEAWLNRTVKLKNIDDKISSMDLLTAGLGRLGNVDTYDADAVLVELQNYEEVMERVQATLVKRLGGEVGVQSVGALFKDAAPSFTTDGPSSDALGLSTTNSQSGAGGSGAGGRDSSSRTSSGKNYLSGWRKLRGKNSTGAANLSLANNGAGGGGAGANKGTIEGQHTMSSVPMTSFAGVEKRTNSSLQKASLDASNGPFEGPLASYMASLAKLCEAAQTLGEFFFYFYFLPVHETDWFFFP